MWWKKKEKKEEEKIEIKKEEDLLKELCGDDAKLYDFLGYYLLVDPLAGISQKDIDTLTEEAEKSGNFRPAVDKAIFEGAQNPAEREQYIKVIQNLASKTIRAMEQEIEKAEKEGLTDRATSLGKRIEDQKFMNERTEDILNIAARFYNEKLLGLGEDERREVRGKEKQRTESEERRIEEQEKAERETRKEERKKMGREERREAEKQEGREGLAAEERKEARADQRRETEREEGRIGEQEKTGRETRKEERGRN